MNKLILAQTDTTVGFLSQDLSRLCSVKKHREGKPFLKVFSNSSLLTSSIRIPHVHKHIVRHAKKTTFIINNQAFRLVTNNQHAHLIERYQWLYSTSANESNQPYSYTYCFEHADIIVEDKYGLYEASPSTLIKLHRKKRQKLR